MTTSWWIIASGPSLTKEDVDKLKGQKVAVINNNYLIAPWADLHYACDAHWWEWHYEKKEMIEFKGEKWSQEQGWNKDLKDKYKHLNIRIVDSKPGEGISAEGPIYQGCNSGIQAINLIYQLYKPDQICLLGYDMKVSGDSPRWHGHHPNKVVANISNWVPRYNAVARDADILGLEIINYTRDTALTCFPRKSMDSL